MILAWGGGMFWSESARGWLGLFASLSDGRIMLRHELTFTRTSPEDVSDRIVAMLKVRKIDQAPIYAQPEIFPKKDARGETIAETFRMRGLAMYAGDDDLANGLSRTRSWLKCRPQADGSSRPSLIIHRDCAHAIRTMPTLVQMDGRPDEIDAALPEAYPSNGIRFYLMSRPSPAAIMETPEPPPGTWGFALRDYFRPPRRFIGDVLR